jgi:hypothetical protein
MIEQFGFVPELTTREAAEQFAAYIRTRRYHEGPEAHLDRELLDYVQRKMQQMPALDSGLFGRLTPRFDAAHATRQGTTRSATAAATAKHHAERTSAGLDDDDPSAAAGDDTDV